ncbi:unnamed protein product [Ectocarpus sp. 12 AP-2014]
MRVDFIEGIETMGGVGDPAAKSGLGIYLYAMNSDMGDKVFYNADGEIILVPQQGSLRVKTEMGILLVVPNEILVMPRDVKFSVDLGIGELGARGYVLETLEGHFLLPEVGPIGSNGLANPRDFESPVAWYEDRDVPYTVLTKFGGKLFSSAMDHSPFDVVAWHGNMTPYKYDLRKFICINSVSKDHPDPSIYTVLTCPSAATPGVAVVDFVVFPPRWMVAEGTFRPPYSAHGPDAATSVGASDEKAPLPVKFDKGLAFMFETKYQLKLTVSATEGKHRDREYLGCWRHLLKNFTPHAK